MHAHEAERSSGRNRRGPARRPESAAPLPGTPAAEALLSLQRAAGNAAVLRAMEQERHTHGPGCGHAQESETAVQRSAVHEVLRGAGSPLETSVRQEMEARLGADFSDVRVHRDAAAQRSAGEIGARAYTSGTHVVLGEGGGDKHTLAHELTHVIQQRQGPVAGTDNGAGLRVSDPGDRFEREAEENATRVMSQAPPVAEAAPGPQATTGGAAEVEAPQVQRAADDEKEHDGPRYRQVKPSKEGTRPADLRLQDRLAREAHAPNARKTPHVAVTHVPGEGIRYSSNSGQKKLSEAKQEAGLASVDAAKDPAAPLSDDPRRRKDQLKLRAAHSGDYETVHKDDPDLAATTKSLRSSRGTWNGGPVHDKKDASVHGEMTLLGEQIAHWKKNPWPLGKGKIKDVTMGGVKKACGACQMAFDAANATIGAQYGYRVVASGSHGEMFRWRAPDWLTGAALEQVAAAAKPRGYEFRGRILEQTEEAAEAERKSEAPRLSSAEHLPSESESEWEQA
ncbi:eCIS core domain-containing protein [Streptomyces niger]